MMAFFLLMWLLGATTEKQRKGIADYFNPTIPVVKASGGGSGAFGGESVFSDNQNSRNGTGAVSSANSDQTAATGEAEENPSEGDAGGTSQKEEPLEELQNALLGVGGETMIEELLRRHVITRISDEGLVIELFETDDAQLFDEQNEPTNLLTLLLETIVPVIRLVENDVAVQAHAKSLPIVVRENNAWDRTTVRADRLRVALEDANWPGDRIKRLTGFADRTPITENPTDPRNNRVEIIVLR
jgi:chemotaxis protein MotB